MKRSSAMFSIVVLVAVSGAAAMQPARAEPILVVDKAGRAMPNDCDGHRPAFTSIQVAVNAAIPGSTIIICPGIYDEQVVITKNNLMIRGTEDRLVVLRPSALPVDPGGPSKPSPRKAIVLVNNASGVTVANLTVDGSAIDTNNVLCPGIFVGFELGIYYRNSSGTVDSIHVTKIKNGTFCTGAILAESGGGGAAQVDIIRNTVDELGSNGLRCFGANTSCRVTRNTVVGPAFIAGILVQNGAVAQITDNVVRGFVCNFSSPFLTCGPDPINQFQSSGIQLLSAGNGSRVAENRISESDIGIYQLVSPDCCVISENKVTNNRFFGIVIQDGNGNTSNNRIKGGQVGIAVVADAVNTVAVLRDDEITGTSIAPVKEIACCGFTAKAIVK